MSQNISKHKAINWIQTNCRYPAACGKELYGRPIELLGWQQNALKKLFNKDGTLSNTPNGVFFGARKTAKSFTAMIILLYRFFHGQGEDSFLTANTYSQSGIIWKMFLEQIYLNREAFHSVKIRKDFCESLRNHNTITRTSQAGRTLGLQGGNVSGLLIVDELGTFTDEAFNNLESLETAQSLAPQGSQSLYLGNAPLYSTHRSVEKIRTCRMDPSWFVKIFAAPESSKIEDETRWQINPFIKEFFKTRNSDKPKFESVYKHFKSKLFSAQRNREDERSFKRLLLGIGCELDASMWINPDKLQVLDNELELKKVMADENIRWACGIDLSLTKDSTSAVFVGLEEPREDVEDPLDDTARRIYIHPIIFYPSVNEKQPNIKQKLIAWSKEGDLTIQNSEAMEFKPFVDSIFNWLKKYPRLKDEMVFVFDPAFASSLYESFNEYPVIKQPFRPKEMTLPTRFMQRKGLQENIFLIGKRNKCFEWMCENTVVNEQSRGWCLPGRLNKNPQLNIDAIAGSVLGLSYILKKRIKHEAFSA